MSTLNYYDFDAFTKAYIATALWSSTGEDDEPLDENHDHTDFSLEALAKMVEDCKTFQERNADNLAKVYETNEVDCFPNGKAGHDFWLTRNGHGAGFWDGDWPEPYASNLTASAKELGSCDIYVGDDGLLYLS